MDDAQSTLEDSPVTIRVVDNDLDVDGDNLTVTTTAVPSDGNVLINADGTPNSGFTGVDTFDHTIDDGNGGTATGMVAVTVVPDNLPPVVADDGYSAADLSTIAGNLITDDTGSGQDSNPDGDPLVLATVNGDPSATGAL